MCKTKYIKVSVSERMPEVNKCVKVVDQEDNIYDGFITDKKVWQVYTQFEYGRIEYWLEEVPDYEVEMKEMLEACFESLKYIHANASFAFHESDTEDHIEHLPYRMQELEKLLTKIKQQS